MTTSSYESEFESGAGIVPDIDDDNADTDSDDPFYQARAMNLDTEMDITPMIDMVFLLLFFFLITSKMAPGEIVDDMPKARHGNIVPVKESVVILIRRGSGNSADVLRADGSSFSRDIEQQNAEVAEYVANGLAEGKKHVIIQASGSVRHGDVGRVSKAVSESLEDGDHINIGVIEQLK